MKSTQVLASLSLLGLAAAVPLNKKRDYAYVTVTAEQLETAVVTTTVWVDPSYGTPTPSVAYIPSSSSAAVFAPSSSVAPVVSSSSAAAYTPPVESTPAPVSTPAYTPAPQPETSEAPAPTTSAAAVTSQAPAYTPAPSSEATPSSSAAPAASSPSTASYSSSDDHTGDLTWYQTGMGSCGIESGENDKIVAISHILMDATDTGNPNNNPLCGKKVSINYNGNTAEATIVDRCTGCEAGDLDLSKGFFDSLTNYGDGRVGGATWTIAA